jgi:hypothetical protein
VCDRGVGRDDQVESFHHRSGVRERSAVLIQTFQDNQSERTGGRGNFVRISILLQTGQFDAGDVPHG